MRRHFGPTWCSRRPSRARCAWRRRRATGCPRSIRPALGGRRGLLEGGDGACRAFLKNDGVAEEVSWLFVGGSRRRAGARGACRRADPSEPAPAAPAVRAGGAVRARQVDRERKGSSSRSSSGPRPAGGYELIAGERRWRAAKEAGVAKVPALVREADDQQSLLLSLVENVAREQLSPVEEARAYAILVDEFGLGVGEIADRVGRSTPSVSNRLRLLELPDDVLWMVARGELSEGHAKAVLSAPGQAERRRLAKRVSRKGCRFARPSARRGRWARGRTGRGIAPSTRPSRSGGARDPAHHGLPAEGHCDAGRDPLRGRVKSWPSWPKRSNGHRYHRPPRAMLARASSVG